MTSNAIEIHRTRPTRRGLLMLCLAGLLASLPASGQSQSTACGEPAQWQAVLQELRSLRIELLQEKIERADARLAGLQQQLQQAEADRNRVRQMERSQAAELAELRERW